MRLYLISFVILFLGGCKTKVASEKCDVLYEKYLSERIKNEQLKALSSLGQAIKCDSTNQDYRFEKIKYLLILNKYENASEDLNALSELNDNYSKYFPLSGLIKIKKGKIEAGEKELNRVYRNLKSLKINKGNFNLFYNRVAVEGYINNKKSAINEIDEYSSIYTESNDKKVLNNLKLMLDSNLDSLSILNKIYGIE